MGFRDILSGYFYKVMLIKNGKPLDSFMEKYDLGFVSKDVRLRKVNRLGDNRIMVRVTEPAPYLTIEKAYEEYSAANTEQKIADVFAVVETKVWWMADSVYDFEKGTEEYLSVRERTDKWFELSERIKNRIFEILHSEGIEIPKTGQITVLEPFMKRNGYRNGNGWWIKDQ